MRNEILLFPNNEILVNALYRTRITHHTRSNHGIRLHISPISTADHIEDDLDVMESIGDFLFDLYLKDPRIANKLVRPKYYYNYKVRSWVFTFDFK